MFIGALALTWFVNRVNARHEARRVEQGVSDDAQVASAWDDFGLGDDPSARRASLDALLDHVHIDRLSQKQSLIRLAIMAVRSDYTDPLVEIAERAVAIDPGCGETRALDALAAAYEGPSERAIAKLKTARAGLAGCSSCGAGVEGNLLVSEVALALDALSSGETLGRADETAGLHPPASCG